MEEGLKKKTGKSLAHWVRLVNKAKLTKHGEIMSFLKQEHDFTHGFANFVSIQARGTGAASKDASSLVDAQYKGKEDLRPIYDKLHALITKLGDDVQVTPKNKAVSFIRKHQFALVKPATKTRIDLGLKIKGQAPEGRLEDSGPFGSMCTHRIQIHSLADVNREVSKWIKRAYAASV